MGVARASRRVETVRMLASATGAGAWYASTMAAASPRKRKPPRRKQAARSKGLSVEEMTEPVAGARALADAIRADGGAVLGAYRDPLGGHPVALAALPIDLVDPTPYQRDRSEPHVKRLANAMERVGRFLDPVIAVRKDGRYWTPNGNHRLGAMTLMGMRSITALVVPEEEVALQILALNTEKAHNLKERSLEVIRMYRGLVAASADATEASFAAIFEEPHFITVGAAYEKRPRYSGGAYAPIVKRLESFLDVPLEEGLAEREARAASLLRLDDAVTKTVDALKSRGLASPYLRYFVVARVNFLRFKKGGTFDFEETIEKMTAMARRFDVGKVKKEDIGKMGGSGVEEE
jgi:ParB family transcriptional regulator, chromosome partitioning protein